MNLHKGASIQSLRRIQYEGSQLQDHPTPDGARVRIVIPQLQRESWVERTTLREAVTFSQPKVTSASQQGDKDPNCIPSLPQPPAKAPHEPNSSWKSEAREAMDAICAVQSRKQGGEEGSGEREDILHSRSPSSQPPLIAVTVAGLECVSCFHH